jgi:disulfide bond formation protein DsbB
MPSSLSQRAPLVVALLAAWIAMLGSLYFSEVAGFVPCKLCWIQRILMYPLTIILLVAMLRRDDGVPTYVLPFSLLGIGVSTYHYLLQKTDLFTESTVCSGGVPCSIAYINWLGFITIPFLALTAFVIITISMAFFLANRPANSPAAAVEEA